MDKTMKEIQLPTNTLRLLIKKKESLLVLPINKHIQPLGSSVYVTYPLLIEPVNRLWVGINDYIKKYSSYKVGDILRINLFPNDYERSFIFPTVVSVSVKRVSELSSQEILQLYPEANDFINSTELLLKNLWNGDHPEHLFDTTWIWVIVLKENHKNTTQKKGAKGGK